MGQPTLSLVRDCKGGDQSQFIAPKPAGALNPPTRFGHALSRAPVMQELFATLGRLAPTELTLMLLGETGSGKDVLARAVHERGARAEGPFVVFDCGAVAKNLAESELFGFERGAFTGALAAHAGAFERADGGTLFLDEIAELPLDLQPRLLRALEQRAVQRLGGKRYRDLNVRVIAATHRDLQTRIVERAFREDLYFRLSAAVVPVPALRHRLEDLPLLVPSLLSDLGQSQLAVSADTYRVLSAHDWPGNVRELKNVLASASAFVTTGELEPKHLLFMSPREPTRVDQLRLGGQTLESLERVAITQTLQTHGGDRVLTATTLGITLPLLLEKMTSLAIEL